MKEAVLRFENPPKEETAEGPTDQLNGSCDNPDEHPPDTHAGYQIPLSDVPQLVDDGYAKDTQESNPSLNTSNLTFFQQSELDGNVYPTTPHGFPTGGISFLQESELAPSQPHEDYTKGERADEIDELAGSPTLPPIQTFSELEGPPKVNLGAGVFTIAEMGMPGNAAAEKVLAEAPSTTVEEEKPKMDWAEEASPIEEHPPEKKKAEDEWTTQSGRHSRHQSQQRGRGAGGQRGGKEGWRAGEGRGSSRGGYRGRGDRGSGNGERRGTWRGGERGRGRGGHNGVSSTTA